MITLCLDTTTGPSSVAISRDGQVLAESLLTAPAKRQSAWLLPELERLLTSCVLTIDQIDLFACSIGPGSFTGVRTGVATIQGLALAGAKPCIGISTLALLAGNLPYAAHPVCPMLDARKDEVYAGLYRCTDLPAPLMEDCAMTPAALLKLLDGPIIFLGDGAQRYRNLIAETLGSKAHFAPSAQMAPRASHGIQLVENLYHAGRTKQPEQLLPNYLRQSEAELSRQQKI
ncbi:MAG: tRNA (adenosine(37)-N6)-threonylcarbamoyltransferase complex dimerization subunit type 1 TsaB [Trichlorobacter sp.]|jgi:tRNA threonylcarbamoyladenosine biosynthesis protein TsaB